MDWWVVAVLGGTIEFATALVAGAVPPLTLEQVAALTYIYAGQRSPARLAAEVVALACRPLLDAIGWTTANTPPDRAWQCVLFRVLEMRAWLATAAPLDVVAVVVRATPSLNSWQIVQRYERAQLRPEHLGMTSRGYCWNPSCLKRLVGRAPQYCSQCGWPVDPRGVPWGLIMGLAQHPAFLTTGFRRPEMARALREQADLDGRAAVTQWLRTVVYPAAIAHALSEASKPTEIRIGTKRLKDEHDRVVLLRPTSLPREQQTAWLRQAARRHAEEIVLGAPRRGRNPIVPGRGGRVNLGYPLRGRHVTSNERAAALPDDVVSRLPPADQTMVRLLRTGAKHARVARALAIKTNDARQRAARLWKQLGLSSPGAGANRRQRGR